MTASPADIISSPFLLHACCPIVLFLFLTTHLPEPFRSLNPASILFISFLGIWFLPSPAISTFFPLHGNVFEPSFIPAYSLQCRLCLFLYSLFFQIRFLFFIRLLPYGPQGMAGFASDRLNQQPLLSERFLYA